MSLTQLSVCRARGEGTPETNMNTNPALLPGVSYTLERSWSTRFNTFLPTCWLKKETDETDEGVKRKKISATGHF